MKVASLVKCVYAFPQLMKGTGSNRSSTVSNSGTMVPVRPISNLSNLPQTLKTWYASTRTNTRETRQKAYHPNDPAIGREIRPKDQSRVIDSRPPPGYYDYHLREHVGVL
jgi:hypothetical protein